jgi:streptomycin 6-kinase
MEKTLLSIATTLLGKKVTVQTADGDIRTALVLGFDSGWIYLLPEGMRKPCWFSPIALVHMEAVE